MFALIAATTASAQAQGESESMELAYDAPFECPTSEAFVREITGRTSRVRFVQTGEKARVMHVAIVKRSNAYEGRLWIEDGRVVGSARELRGASCAEIVGALGLIGALAVDPKASMDVRPPPSAAGVTPTSAGSTPTAAPAPPLSAPPPESPPPKSEPATPPQPQTEARPATPKTPRELPTEATPSSRGRLSLGAQLEVAWIADAVVSPRVFGELELGGQDRLVSLALRVALERSLDVPRRARVGQATLRFTTASLEGCPLRFMLTRSLDARPCVGITAGALGADASGVDGATSRTRPWVSLTGAARLGWAFAGPFEASLEAGIVAPLLRETFLFEPNIGVYVAPPLAFVGRVGLGVRF